MIIRREGGHVGSVGGGCGEAAVIQAGLAALAAGAPRFVRVDLTEDVADESEAACGGTMDCLVRPWGPELSPVVAAVLKSTAARRPVRLFTCLADGPEAGGMVIAPALGDGSDAADAAGTTRVPPFVWAGLSEDEASACIRSFPAGSPAAGSGRSTRPAAKNEAGTVEVAVAGRTVPFLVEELEPPPVLLILGGGHIGLPLAEMGKTLGYEVVVVDDRPSFANRDRFPRADRIVVGPFDEVLASYPVDRATYAVIVTRGHREDVVCLRRLLGRGAGYLGMIGSRRRVAGILEALRREVGRETLEELHSPVGLDIGAQTPAEIALAILAEIVQTRRGGTGRSLTLTRAGRGRIDSPESTGSTASTGPAERKGAEPCRPA